MKKLLPLFILLLAVSAFGQIKAPSGFTATYDKFKDLSHVYFSGYGVGVMESVGFFSNGADLVKDQERFYLSFAGTRCHGFCFNDSTLIVLADGERIHSGTDKGLGDSAFYMVTRDTIAKIAAAKLVEYQVGRFEGKWEAKTLAKFKTLLDLGTVAK